MNRASSFFSHKAITLAAGTTMDVNVSGAFFFCTESSKSFFLQWNYTEWIPMEAGLGFRLAAPDQFVRLSFKNPHAEDITFEFFAGVGELIDGRITTIQDRVVQVYQKVFPTRCVGHGEKTVGNTAPAVQTYWIDPDVKAGPGESRKQVIITNNSTERRAVIVDADGNSMGEIPSGNAWTVDSTDKIGVKSATGDNIKVMVAEIFYRKL